MREGKRPNIFSKVSLPGIITYVWYRVPNLACDFHPSVSDNPLIILNSKLDWFVKPSPVSLRSITLSSVNFLFLDKKCTRKASTQTRAYLYTAFDMQTGRRCMFWTTCIISIIRRTLFSPSNVCWAKRVRHNINTCGPNTCTHTHTRSHTHALRRAFTQMWVNNEA